VGIIGLERIATLEVLNLTLCKHITSVTSLRHCTALRELILDGTSVTDAGIAGLECIVTLTKLSLVDCKLITSVSSLRHSPSLRDLDISYTGVTAAGIEGLDEIGTLQRLKAERCAPLDASTLRRCRSLREVDLSMSDVPDAVLAALADVSTLETLKLSHCRQVRDVSALARSVSLRELNLSLQRRERCRHCGVGAHPIPHLALTGILSLHHERDEPVSLQVAAQAGSAAVVSNRRRPRRPGTGACTGIRRSAQLCSCH
jgi:hypothetical protein